MSEDDLVERFVATGKWFPLTARLFIRARYKCQYCGFDLLGSVDALKLMEVDHIVPPSKGGSREDISNLVIACTHCNRHLKRSWDPRTAAGPTADREQLIAAVRTYVSELREKREPHLKASRAIAEYCEMPNPNSTRPPAAASE